MMKVFLPLVAVSWLSPWYANCQSVGEFELIDWSDNWIEAEQDWFPAGLCQGDCEGEIYGDEYCLDDLVCRRATPEDLDACTGVAIVNYFYCFPPEETETGAETPQEAQEAPQEAQEPVETTPFTWEAWNYDESLDQWILPVCSGGCEDWDGYCEGDSICVYAGENFQNPSCTGFSYEDAYYCVPPTTSGPEVLQAQEATTGASFTYEQWTWEEGTGWTLPTCGAGCDGDDEYCSGTDVCVWGGPGFSNPSCEGQAEDGWYYCVPSSA